MSSTIRMSRQVLIQGTMVWEEPVRPGPPGGGGEQPPVDPGPPPVIWGPTDPRPTPPINLPPWGWTGQRPPGTWGGAGEPFPTPPIQLPGQPPYYPAHPIVYPPGTWGGSGEPFPTPPIHMPPPPIGFPPGGSPVPPVAGVPIDGKLVFLPGYGWVFIPDSMTPTPPTTPPPTDAHPEHPIVLPPEEPTQPGE